MKTAKHWNFLNFRLSLSLHWIRGCYFFSFHSISEEMNCVYTIYICFCLENMRLILTENRYQMRREENSRVSHFCIFYFNPGNWSGSFWLNDFDGWQGEKVFFCLCRVSPAAIQNTWKREVVFLRFWHFVKNTFFFASAGADCERVSVKLWSGLTTVEREKKFKKQFLPSSKKEERFIDRCCCWRCVDTSN